MVLLTAVVVASLLECIVVVVLSVVVDKDGVTSGDSLDVADVVVAVVELTSGVIVVHSEVVESLVTRGVLSSCDDVISGVSTVVVVVDVRSDVDRVDVTSGTVDVAGDVISG